MQLDSAPLVQLPFIPHPMFAWAVGRGVDMSWYAKSTKLSCPSTAIRLLKTDGSLWTLAVDIDAWGHLSFLPDKMAKPGVRECANRTFVCSMCGYQSVDYFDCVKHGELTAAK